MRLTRLSLAEILREHVTLEVERMDRMYLNVYIASLQRESGASWFLKQQRKYPVASSISRAFVEAIEAYAKMQGCPYWRLKRDNVKTISSSPNPDKPEAKRLFTTKVTKEHKGERKENRFSFVILCVLCGKFSCPKSKNFTDKVLRFFRDCAREKWPLRGSS
jgi:hypothetical protein